ncbi:3-coathanger stack domain-containing protein [Runella sp.]|uniref:3-coathanger stack domain-containing protein n=1 Tax=Runella sp. TaxID=1960881 RepID=UPI003D110158
MKNTLLFFFIFIGFLSHAQWSPTAPTVVCDAVKWQNNATMVADGAGGYIMAWRDYRTSSLPNDAEFSDIYIQRLNANGVPQWTANGLLVCGAAHEQTAPKLALCKTSDNQTRIMVVWLDQRDKVNNTVKTKIYAQSFDLNGIAQWAADGVQVADCNGFTSFRPDMIPSSDGKRALFFWGKVSDSALYLQALNADNGNTLYSGDGTLLVSGLIGGFSGLEAKISQAGNSTDVNVVWNAYAYANSSYNIYAQRINVTTGNKQWINPANVCLITGNKNELQIQEDIIVWKDHRFSNVGQNYEIFAQRLNADGSLAWNANGINVSNTPGYQLYPRIAPAGINSVWVTWADEVLNAKDSSFVSIQKINSDGTLAFGSQGIKLISNYANRAQGMVVSQDDGGALVLARSNPTGSIYRAHKISSAGQKLWGPIGQPVGGLTELSIEDPVDIEGIPLIGGGAVFSVAMYDDIWALRAKICDSPPTAPTVTTSYRRCVPGSYAINLPSSGCPSGTVQWFAAPDGLRYLGTTTNVSPNQTTIYNRDTTQYVYAECVINGCASTAALVPAHIQIAESSFTPAQLPNYPFLSTDPPAVVLSQSTITAQNKVDPPANVLYEATQAVHLSPGFQANTGAVFRAEVKTCVNVN